MAHHALIIGVSKYFDINCFSSLLCCEKDAWALHLRAVDPKRMAFQPSNVMVMHDSAPKEEAYKLPIESQIFWAMQELVKKAKPEDTVLFYFSGHGCVKDGVAYIVAKDTRWDLLGQPDKGVRISQISELLTKCKASKKIAIIDSCHSGEDLTKTGPPPVDDKLHDALEEMAKGIAVLSSCEKGQRSWALKDQSVFTKYLLEAIDGKAADNRGDVTVFSLSEYVGRGVYEWTQTQKPPPTQAPTFFGKMHAQGFILVKGGQTSPKQKPSKSRRVGWWGWLKSLLSALPFLSFEKSYEFPLEKRLGRSSASVPITISSTDGSAAMETNALLDTGAACSVIPIHMAKILDLKPLSMTRFAGLVGQQIQTLYSLKIEIAEKALVIRALTMESLSEPILGMDVLDQLDVRFDSPRNRIVIRAGLTK